jgi:hypothetical protein
MAYNMCSKGYDPLYSRDGKTVCLYDLLGLGLVLKDDLSDITYFNQTAGHVCLQMFAKGTFVFVLDDTKSLCNTIAAYMINKEGLSLEDADFLDNAFSRSYGAKHLSVDRTKLRQSMEAWVHVTIDNSINNEVYTGFTVTEGILTWPNSD